ncbi:FAD/NAD(P)-binding protein [Streptomyces sp. NBC_00046]|uniref:FAD/NAD(P)-binding protein n=1 Tax=Streptomyces sp. NBC_00046 TaxID=2975626 RepID=UPI0032533641
MTSVLRDALEGKMGIRIALIGGGAAAVSFIDSLLRHAESFERDVEICIYEPGNLAKGQAFGPDLDCALLNLPNGSMSIRTHEEDHFLRWLESQPIRHHLAYSGPDPADSFSPRRFFGQYLEANLRVCRETAEQRGWKVSVHEETVIEVAEAGQGTLLVRTGCEARSYTHVILAIGAGSPADPFQLKGTPGFHANPYPLADVLPGLRDPHAPVLIIGTGLTAVDATMGLLHLGHQGCITMASRNGILPQVRAAKEKKPLSHVTEERIQDQVTLGGVLQISTVLDLLQEELKAEGSDIETEFSWFHPSISASDHLRYQLERPRSNPLQSILSRISFDLGDRIRYFLSGKAARALASHTQRMKSLQSPMPERTARKLLAAMDSGQLSVLPGLTEVRFQSKAFLASIADEEHGVHFVIDATRTSPGATHGRSRPLISSLRSNGYTTWDLSGGLRVEPRTGRVRLPSGDTHPRLFAIGEITAGATYYAGSLPAVNRGADAVASALACMHSR